MNKKKNPKPNLTVLKTYPEEIDMILKFFAISDTIDDALSEPSFRRRLDAIPNATSGLKMTSGRILQLLYDLSATLPETKRNSIIRMSPHMKYKVYLNPPVSKVGNDKTVIAKDDLGLLCQYAHMNCDFCLEPHCNNCKLAKVFDHIIAYDRDKDESWSTWSGWADIEGTDWEKTHII